MKKRRKKNKKNGNKKSKKKKEEDKRETRWGYHGRKKTRPPVTPKRNQNRCRQKTYNTEAETPNNKMKFKERIRILPMWERREEHQKDPKYYKNNVRKLQNSEMAS